MLVIVAAAIGGAYYVGVFSGPQNQSSNSSVSSSSTTQTSTSSSSLSSSSTWTTSSQTTVQTTTSSSVVSGAVSIAVDNVYVGQVNASTYRYLFNMTVLKVEDVSGLPYFLVSGNFSLSAGGAVLPEDRADSAHSVTSSYWRVAFDTPQPFALQEVQFICPPKSCSSDNNTYVASTTSFPAVTPVIFLCCYTDMDGTATLSQTFGELMSSTWATDLWVRAGFSGGLSTTVGELGVFIGNDTERFMATYLGRNTCGSSGTDLCPTAEVNAFLISDANFPVVGGTAPNGCVFAPVNFYLFIQMPNKMYGSAQSPYHLLFYALLTYYGNTSCTGATGT